MVHLEKVRLIAELPSQARVSLSPRLKPCSNRGQQTGFLPGPFQSGRLAEESRAQGGVPTDVVSAAHLVLKEAGEQQALAARGFHHRAVVAQARVEHNMLEHLAERR